MHTGGVLHCTADGDGDDDDDVEQNIIIGLKRKTIYECEKPVI